MKLPKIGLGTYNQSLNQSELISYALKLGYELIDTAPNYNNGISQREVSKALSQCINQTLISTKVGFVSDLDRRDFYIKNGIAKSNDFFKNHCLSKSFVKYEIEKNLQELGIESIDILFIHNPEQQLEIKSKSDFFYTLSNAIEIIETFCEQGKVKQYGISSWDGFGINGKQPTFTLDEIHDIVFKIAGKSNRFRCVQIPLSIVHYDELYNYAINKSGLLCDAERLSLSIFANSPLHKGELLKLIDSEFLRLFGINNCATACLLFLKSFQCINTILVGATSKSQIEDNIQIEALPPLSREKVELILNLLTYGK